MSIRNLLFAVAAGYNSDSLTSEGQIALRTASSQLADVLAPGLKVVTGGGQGRATTTPWIAVLDPDETSTPQNGIYIVYIFKPTLDEVVLTLNQGITNRSELAGIQSSRSLLAAESKVLREALSDSERKDLAVDVDFESSGWRQKGYSAGNILARTYKIGDMPAEFVLVRDLLRFLALYESVLARKREILQSKPGLLSLAAQRIQLDRAALSMSSSRNRTLTMSKRCLDCNLLNRGGTRHW